MKGKEKKKKVVDRVRKLDFKRVDQLWDSEYSSFALQWVIANCADTIHNYKITESAKENIDEFQQYIFTVRRRFDWENKYRDTVVDIKSKLLKEALQEVMKDVKGVSLVENTPIVSTTIALSMSEGINRF